MVADPHRVTAVFSAAAQFTDSLLLRGVGVHGVHVHIREEVATFVGTIALIASEPGAPQDFKAKENFVVAAGEVEDHFREFMGSWDLRLFVGAYTSGQARVFLKGD